MVYLTIMISILFIAFEKKKLIYRYLPIFFLISGMLIWGLFGLNKTGRMPFLSNISSTNQLGLALVFNDKFKHNYPEHYIDELEPEILNEYPPFNGNVPSFKSEWEYSDYFKEKNIKFFKENKLEIIKGIVLKIKFLFYNIYDYGATYQKNNILISHILNRIVFLFSLLIFSLKFTKNKINKEDIYFIALITTNLLPHIIGWITSKHLVPIFIICHIYCLINTYRIIYKKF
jgi:hypothetical protein